MFPSPSPDFQPPIPPDFARFMVDVHGKKGKNWLDALPALLNRCRERWGLQLQAPFAALSYNFVLPALRSDGSTAVLKLGVPHHDLLTEIDALRVYGGDGIIRLLDADPKRGALLLEHAQPGKMLLELGDNEKETAVAAHLMRQLWKPAPANHNFPTIADWSNGLARLRRHFDGSTGPLPAKLVAQAETLFADLLASMSAAVLLHGDLHHYNILSATRQPWLIIDPKGVVGEPAYEVGAFLRNPLELWKNAVDLDRLLRRRIDQFAEILELDRQRIVGWGIAQAVLSAWWCIEDNASCWEAPIAIAEALAETY